MGNVFFSSDLHFGHHNVIEYSSRPWSTVEEMNEALILRWNSKVQPDDTVYFLGDFCLTGRIELVNEWLGRLNGQWRIIAGNHDAAWLKKVNKIESASKIKWIKDYVERSFEVDGVKHKIVMCHFPMLTWHGSHWDEGRGSIMLHGHCHGSIQHLNEKVRRMDVGVDCNDWYPVSLRRVIASNINKPPLDHHNVE